jgi:GNAT superfamily N-acetyltransferase
MIFILHSANRQLMSHATQLMMIHLIFNGLLWVFPSGARANDPIIERPAEHSQYYHIITLDSDKAGCVATYDLKIIDAVIIHSLYVVPEYRHRGYAEIALRKVLDDYAAAGYETAYIQIGPFEVIDNKIMRQPIDYDTKVAKLKKLYSRLGFESASPLEQFFAQILYPLWGIEADPAFLMRCDIRYSQASERVL